MKKTSRASTFIPAQPHEVFDIFTNYETYRSLVGVKNTCLIAAGQPEAGHGIGAIRELDLGFGIFHEQVTDLDYPYYWDYRFIKWPLSLTHIGGRMQFTAVAGGTQMIWESTIETKGIGRIALPCVAWLTGYGLKLLSLQMKAIVRKEINKK